jgi:hypothetical protein
MSHKGNFNRGKEPQEPQEPQEEATHEDQVPHEFDRLRKALMATDEGLFSALNSIMEGQKQQRSDAIDAAGDANSGAGDGSDSTANDIDQIKLAAMDQALGHVIAFFQALNIGDGVQALLLLRGELYGLLDGRPSKLLKAPEKPGQPKKRVDQLAVLTLASAAVSAFIKEGVDEKSASTRVARALSGMTGRQLATFRKSLKAHGFGKDIAQMHDDTLRKALSQNCGGEELLDVLQSHFAPMHDNLKRKPKRRSRLTAV